MERDEYAERYKSYATNNESVYREAEILSKWASENVGPRIGNRARERMKAALSAYYDEVLDILELMRLSQYRQR